jgi:hypothetical protein
MHTEHDESVEAAIDLARFAEALTASGRIEDAVMLGSLSETLRDELGARIPWVERRQGRTLEAPKQQLSHEDFRAAWERGRRLTPDDAVAIALGGSAAEPSATNR